MRAERPGPVRRIRADEGPALQTLRLAALASDPLAFGATLEEDAKRPASDWAHRAEAGATSDTEAIFVLADEDHPLRGMVGAFTHEGGRFLWGMWVAPDHRGHGNGERLLQVVLAWCRQHPGELPVRLDVNPSQVAALHLYERHGFRASGDDRPLGHHPPARKRPMHLVEDHAPARQRG
jgi:GNAT superfamily N-acetyltransferase